MADVARPRVESGVAAKLSAMMFLQFFVWGGWYVTIGNFMNANGMKDHVPWAYSVCPIAAIISPFFLGIVADRFFATERVLGVMHLLGGAALMALPSIAAGGAGSQTLFNAILLLHAICYMPTLGLSNTVAFHHVTNPEKQFPLIRVLGTIGWIVAGLIISAGLHADTKAVQFYIAGGAALLLGLYSFALPHTPAPSAGKKPELKDILGLDSLALLKQPAFAVFMISSFLICIPLAFYYSFAPIFVADIKIPDPALHMSFGQMSEFFFMLVMPLFFARLGVKYMLLVGMAAWVARYGLFSAAAANHALWMVMGGILLHGICYDFFFVTGQIYVDKKASANIRAQAQGFLVLVTQGVGMLIGAQAAGAIVNSHTVGDVKDWHGIWLIPCIAAGVIMVLFFLLFRDDTSIEEEQIADIPPAAAPVEPAPAPGA